MRGFVICLVVLILFAADLCAAEPVSFNRDIRPILSDTCYRCHGPDAGKRKADLRLDVDNAKSRTAIRDELIDRITSNDDSIRMPPPESGKTLTAKQIRMLKQWVKEGGKFEKHWALIPPRRPVVPQVRDRTPLLGSIDRFLQRRLEKEQLRPSKPAERAVLVRRVTLDLTGLPPTRAEVRAFVSDDRPGAYERLVDRLLASPRFGEHWGRFWLDAARYGDTHGLHLDNLREMWAYRDWVVRAYNHNKPFNEFTVEQLAGDLLPGATLEQKIATGFNRAHVTTSEGGSIAEEVYVRNVVDRVATTGTVFLGGTIRCARCHDHKFDPYTMNDFYSMFAFFNNIDGSPLDGNKRDHAPVIRAPAPWQKRVVADLQKRIAGKERELFAVDSAELKAERIIWEETLRRDSLAFGDWYIVGPFSDEERFLYSRQHGPETRKYVDLKKVFRSKAGEELRWTRFPHWRDAEVHRDLPHRLGAMFGFRQIYSPDNRTIEATVGASRGLKVYLNGDFVLAVGTPTLKHTDRRKISLKLKKGVNQLVTKMVNLEDEPGFYFRPRGGAPPSREIIAAAAKLSSKRTAAENTKIAEYFRYNASSNSQVVKIAAELKRLRNDLAAVRRSIGVSLIWKERATAKPAFVLKRGEYTARGKRVTRATPGFLPPMHESLPKNRLGLAKWLVEGNHPLTARVAVNRIWQNIFGTGIVKTSEDFGSQGEPPSHPELLDWLAVEFVDSGWNVKHMIRQLVLTRAYQQDSRVSKELLARDPTNRLLARGPRFRIDAEMLRDQALFHSGLLVEFPGGRSVRPPQPEGLWFAVGYTSSNTARFVADSGREKLHRRTVYTFIKRTSPPPQLATLDAPSREECVVRRERTNTPLQALLLMNDPQYMEAARALGERAMKHGGTTDRDRAIWLLRLVIARSPEAWEIAEVLGGLADHRMEYKSDPTAAKKLISIGSGPADRKLDPVELAAWTMTATLVLNLDEALNKN